jgi:hypothetical protein
MHCGTRLFPRKQQAAPARGIPPPLSVGDNHVQSLAWKAIDDLPPTDAAELLGIEIEQSARRATRVTTPLASRFALSVKGRLHVR